MTEIYVMDSFALLAHFEDEPGGERVREILKKGKEGSAKVYLSIINWGEVYYQTYRRRGARKAEEIELVMDQLPLHISPADREITAKASRLKAKYPVAYADCFAAGLAQQKSAKVVTGDPEFEKLEKEVAIEWIVARQP